MICVVFERSIDLCTRAFRLRKSGSCKSRSDGDDAMPWQRGRFKLFGLEMVVGSGGEFGE